MELDLTIYHDELKFRQTGKDRLIFDPVRKKYVIVQPEELVRQSWIMHLSQELKISASSIAVEKQLLLSQGPRRFDLVIYRKARPVVLFEFKSFKTKLNDKACMQAAVYNFELKVPYILLSNGIDHRMFEIDFEGHKVRELDSWPDNLI